MTLETVVSGDCYSETGLQRSEYICCLRRIQERHTEKEREREMEKRKREIKGTEGEKMFDGAWSFRSWKNLESTAETDEVSLGKPLTFIFSGDAAKGKEVGEGPERC